MDRSHLNLLLAIFLTWMSGYYVSASDKTTPIPIEDSQTQLIKVYMTDDKDGHITSDLIMQALEAEGFTIDSDDDMNRPFEVRFGDHHYETHRLLSVHSADHVARLVAKHPKIGLVTPMTLSVWSDDTSQTLRISIRSLHGIAQITGIPKDDDVLIDYLTRLDRAIRKALPDIRLQKSTSQTLSDEDVSLSSSYTTELDPDSESTFEQTTDDLESEFESEMNAAGFLLTGFISLDDELAERGVKAFRLYDTYSVCDVDVMYTLTKSHPELGALVPCSFYIYNKQDANTIHMGIPSSHSIAMSGSIRKDPLSTLIRSEQRFEETMQDFIE